MLLLLIVAYNIAIYINPILDLQNDPKEVYVPQLGNAVCRVSTVHNLGIIIFNDLKWSSHISHIVAKSSCCSYQILLPFTTNNVWILLEAYITYIRPKIDIKL